MVNGQKQISHLENLSRAFPITPHAVMEENSKEDKGVLFCWKKLFHFLLFKFAFKCFISWAGVVVGVWLCVYHAGTIRIERTMCRNLSSLSNMWVPVTPPGSSGLTWQRVL